MTQNTLPAFLQGFQPPDLAQQALATIGSGSPPLLSIEGGRFTLVTGTDEEQIATFDPKIGVYVDVVVIDFLERKSKIYYGHGYDPASPQPPKCFSDNGLAPSTQAGEPQSTTCASCPNQVVGSAVNHKGKQVRACRDYIKAAVVLPAYPDEVFLLRIPPNSFKHLSAYSEWCRKSRVAMQVIVTRLYFEQGVLGTLMFHGLDYVRDEACFRYIQKLLADKATDSLVGRNDVARDPAVPIARAGVQQLGAPPAHVQQVQQPVQQVASAVQPQMQATVAGPGVQTQFVPVQQPQQFAPQPGPVLPPPQQVQPSQQAAQPQPAQEPTRRRRRTQAQIAADNAAANGQAGQPAPANTFGMAAGQAPTSELDAQLDSIFGPPK